MNHYKNRKLFKPRNSTAPPLPVVRADIPLAILDRIESIDESKNIVMVEGRTDLEFYKLFINIRSTEMIDVDDIACNKKAIIEALLAINESGDSEMKALQKRVIGFVDRDLDRKKSLRDVPNLMVTDTRDIETMVMISNSFDKYMEDKSKGDPATKKKLDLTLNKRGIKDLRSALMVLTSEFSTIKTSALWISPEPSIRNLDPGVYISNDLMLDKERLINDVARKTRGLPSEVRRKMALTTEKCRNDTWSLCEGHDMVHILSNIMNRFFYQSWPPGQRPTSGDIWKELQELYDWSQFRETKMCGSIMEWEKTNDRTVLSNKKVVV